MTRLLNDVNRRRTTFCQLAVERDCRRPRSNAPILAVLSRIDKLAQHTLIAHPLVTEQDDIHRHIILLQLFPQLDQCLFARCLGSRGRR